MGDTIFLNSDISSWLYCGALIGPNIHSTVHFVLKVQKSVFRRKNRDIFFCLRFFNFNFEFCLLFSFYSFEIRFPWFLHTNMSMEVTKYTITLPYAYEWPYAYAYDHMAIWPYKWPSLKTLNSHIFCLGDLPKFWHQILIILRSFHWAKYSLYSTFRAWSTQKCLFRRKNRYIYYFCLIFMKF